jgi:hypothetical protein
MACLEPVVSVQGRLLNYALVDKGGMLFECVVLVFFSLGQGGCITSMQVILKPVVGTSRTNQSWLHAVSTLIICSQPWGRFILHLRLQCVLHRMPQNITRAYAQK